MKTPEEPVPAPTNSLKRKLSTSTQPGNPQRPVKRRASKACACCRARKVRCNVVENGIPCTNCRLDRVECILMESRRRRRPTITSNTSQPPAESPQGSVNNEPGDVKPAQEEDFMDLDLEDFSVDMDGHDPTLPSTDLFHNNHPVDQHVPHLIYQTQGYRMSHEERTRRLSMSQQPIQATALPMGPPMPPLLLSDRSRSLVPSLSKLPPFIRELPKRIGMDEIDFLTKRGALELPPKALRIELLRCFVQYVHPYMPTLDLKEFLSIVLQVEDMKGPVSLLLYQAVMFAGSSFVDLPHLRAAGFSTRRAARKALFQRARLLYDFDYETDRITLVQALLMLTYWYETPDDQKDTWHWMGVSLSLAHTMGLNRDPSNSSLSHHQQRLWKRIWWSILMRDRLIALGMRRPTRIQTTDYDVPMMTLRDFDVTPYPDEIVRCLGKCMLLQSRDQLTNLATMCIEKAKLCCIISNVLSTQYSALGTSGTSHRDSTIMLIPRGSPGKSTDLQACDMSLDNWLLKLDPAAHYNAWAPPEEDCQVLFLHRALLKMIYQTTVSALHRPQVLPSTPRTPISHDDAASSRLKVKDAAVGITDIAQQLQSRDLVKFLPTAGVTVLLPAIIVHLLDIKSTDDSVRTSSLCRFHQCMQALTRLREIYASADHATLVLEAAIQKANLHFPTMPRSPNAQQRSPNVKFPFEHHHRQHRTSISTLTPPPETIPEDELIMPSTIAPNDTVHSMNETPPASTHSSSTGSADSEPSFETSSPLLTSTSISTSAATSIPTIPAISVPTNCPPNTDSILDTTHPNTVASSSSDFDPSATNPPLESFFDGLVMPANSAPSTRPGSATGMKDFFLSSQQNNPLTLSETNGVNVSVNGNFNVNGGVGGGVGVGPGGESSAFTYDLESLIDFREVDGMVWS